MQISKIIILALISIKVFCGISLHAQIQMREKGKGLVKLSAGSVSGSSYFEKDGNRRSGLYDSLALSNYTFDLSGTMITLDADYGVMDDFTVFANMPLGAYTLTEKFVTDSIGNRPIRQQLSRTLLSWLGIGTRYKFYSGPLHATFTGEFRLPAYIGIPNDPQEEFLGGGSKEGIIGLQIGIPFEKSWIAVHGALSLRDANWNDRFFIHGEAGFSSVERTNLKFFVDIQQPLGAQRDIPEFLIRKIHPAEFFTSAGAAFTVNIQDGLVVEAMYNLRLLGTTSWSLGNVMLSAGYIF
jgi:hypothetical protein